MLKEELASFAEFFEGYADQFAVLGGAACSQWFGEASLEFRQTKDLDIVLILEAKSREFYSRLWEYLHLGGYSKWQRSDGQKTAFRFVGPAKGGFPFMIELLSRVDAVELPTGQTVVPIETGDGLSSLSAVLLEDAYYTLILEHRDVTKSGLPAVTPEELLLLKAKAHLNLLDDKANGKVIRDKDIRKHRNDVFHLAYLLDEDNPVELSPTIAMDLNRFLDLYQPSASAWEGISQSLYDSGFEMRSPAELINLIRKCYRQ